MFDEPLNITMASILSTPGVLFLILSRNISVFVTSLILYRDFIVCMDSRDGETSWEKTDIPYNDSKLIMQL